MCSNDHFPTYSRVPITEEDDGYYFIYYLQISVKKGIDTNSLEPHREESNRKCNSCFEIFIIKKNFTLNHKNCNSVTKLDQSLVLIVLGRCLYFGMIMLYTESSQIPV